MQSMQSPPAQRSTLRASLIYTPVLPHTCAKRSMQSVLSTHRSTMLVRLLYTLVISKRNADMVTPPVTCARAFWLWFGAANRRSVHG